MESRDYAIMAAKALDQKLAEDILVIDIGEKSSFADYLILASGSNERLIAALTDDVEDRLAKEDLLVKSVEGTKESGWILMDYGDMIVNVLTKDMREKYNIEKVWADCETVDWEQYPGRVNCELADSNNYCEARPDIKEDNKNGKKV